MYMMQAIEYSLGANESSLQHCKARSHPHDECAHDEKVKSIECVRKFSHLRRYLSCRFHEYLL
jgi:hypothetical protein